MTIYNIINYKSFERRDRTKVNATFSYNHQIRIAILTMSTDFRI